MAASKSIAAGGNATSDAFSIAAATVHAEVQIKADNDGTPASGDVLTVYSQGSLGDPDADPDSANEFASLGTTPQAEVLAVLDTYATTGGADPAISPARSVSPLLKQGKLYAVNGSGGRAITVSAQLAEIDVNGAKTYTQITWT